MEQDLAAAAAAAAAMFEDDEWNAVDLDSFMIPNFQSQVLLLLHFIKKTRKI